MIARVREEDGGAGGIDERVRSSGDEMDQNRMKAIELMLGNLALE